MRKLFIYLLLLLALTACGGEPSSQITPTATPNPGEIALQMMQQQMAANATAQVLGLNFTATAQIVGATSTAEQLIVEGRWTEQARMDAQATADQNRADGQATQARIDLDARATQQRRDDDAATEQARQDALSATQQAFVAMQSTASYNATSTFTVMTLTAIPPHATMTQLAVDNQIAVNNLSVTEAALATEQAEDTNKNWVLWYLGAIVVFGAGLLWVVRKSRWNAFSDEDGTLLGFGHDDKYINPRLLTGPVLDLTTGLVAAATPEQAKVTERAQIVEALKNMPVSPSQSGAAVFNKYFGEAQAKPYEIIDADALPAGLVDVEALKSMEGDWKEAKGE